MFIVILNPFFLPVPFGSLCSEGLEGNGQHGHPESAPAVVTSLLLKFFLLQQILHCWSLSLLMAGEEEAPHCPGTTLLLVPAFYRALGIPPKSTI